ncbi:MAG: PDZ domain-containing protein [Firmicutes bacterium]|nr:PDZ domain-containing protein [Bacillota bacterium]
MRNKRLLSYLLVCLMLVLTGVMVIDQFVLSDVSLAREEVDASLAVGEVNPNEEIVSSPQASKAGLLSATIGNPHLIADIAEQASPAIVYIQVEWPQQKEQRNRISDPFWDFFDSWFFSPFTTQPRSVISQGTGFIIDESGIILTNQHVVGNKGENQVIKVTLNAPGISGEFNAEILGSDAKLDLAVLQILDADGPFPTVPLGDSDASRPGEWVIAIGNPYGKQFEHTVTVGVLSAKGREIAIQVDSNTTQVYRNLMQTDAAINRGNSGGPLLDITGKVIGINTAVHAQAQGIGFAIPINVAKEVLQQLIETGGVQRPWLGVYPLTLTPELANSLRIPNDKGVLISDIIADSPAEKAGIKPWDVIRRVDNNDVTSQEEFLELIGKKAPGDQVLLTVLRDGQVHLITVTLENRPPEYL